MFKAGIAPGRAQLCAILHDMDTATGQPLFVGHGESEALS